MTDNIIIKCGDCLELMREIPDGSVDAIICDLPYGTTACSWDVVIPFDKMWDQINRVSKRKTPSILFGSQPFTTKLISSNFDDFRYEWIWEKNSSGGFILAKQQPMKYHENILVFYKEIPTYNPVFEEYSESTKTRFALNGKVNSDKMQEVNFYNKIQGITRVADEIMLERGSYPKTVQKFKSVPNANGKRIHPTQKPIDLIEYLVKTYTNEGDTVLDFTMGSGTTGIASVKTKRKFIGYEMNQDYFNIATERIHSFQEVVDVANDFEEFFT